MCTIGLLSERSRPKSRRHTEIIKREGDRPLGESLLFRNIIRDYDDLNPVPGEEELTEKKGTAKTRAHIKGSRFLAPRSM